MTQSNEPTIAEMNYAIGVFDNKSFTMSHITDYTAFTAPKMKYHYSWDSLMKVVEKIYKLIAAEEDTEMKHLIRCRWKPIENELLKFNKTNVHYCVYQFITWFNQQNKKNVKTTISLLRNQ